MGIQRIQLDNYWVHQNNLSTVSYPDQVLCELQVAMLERNISVDRRHQDVSRRIMTKDIRHVENDSIRNLRDWYIYRDYMNSLEYAIDAFTHLKRNRRDH